MLIEGNSLYFKDFDITNHFKNERIEEINILKQCEPIFNIFKEMRILFEYITITYSTKPKDFISIELIIYDPIVIKFDVSLDNCSIVYGIPINKEFDINELIKDVKKKLLEESLSQ